MPQGLADCSTGLGIPDSNRLVIGSRNDAAPTGRVGNSPNPIGMPLKRLANCNTGIGVPDSNGVVGGSGDDVLPIRRVGNSADMCHKSQADLSTRRRIPDSNDTTV